jgi:sigma-B regulation protein RsbU (phosphoserine phosphatase)
VIERSVDGHLSCMEVWGGNTSTNSTFDRPGITCRVWNKSYGSGDAGGDVYYLSSCASGRVTRFLLADVCGHGESAADGAAALRDLMRQHVNQIRQTRIFQSVNRELAVQDQSGRFATALIGTWFEPKSEMVLSNAGHPIPLLYRASTGKWLQCQSKIAQSVGMQNMPLGVDERTGYSEHRVKLHPGDLLLCYTDALTEARNADGDYFQTSGLTRILRSLEGSNPGELIQRFLEHLQSASSDNLDRDDVTIMLFEATSKPVPLTDNLLAPWRLLQDLLGNRVVTSHTSRIQTSEPVIRA